MIKYKYWSVCGFFDIMVGSKKTSFPSKNDSKKKQEINYFVIFGDSLSDAKNMSEKASFLGSWAKWLWLKIVGLDKSPKERFTNGYTWADSLKAFLVSKFISDDKIKKDSSTHFGKHNLDNADISDDILYQPPSLRKKYTFDEVATESREVKRKQHAQNQREFLVLAQGPTKLENHTVILAKPEQLLGSADVADAIIAHRYKENAHRSESVLTSRQESADDVADQFITDPHYRNYIQDYYTLENSRTAQYNGQNFIENKSQGGSSSYDYSWKGTFLSIFSPLTSIKLFFTRLIVSSLPKQVEKFLKENEQRNISKEQKEKTLITVFSGANDLMSVNSEPSKEAAELAVQSNFDNIELLIKKGYRNFVLCNLPDLSLTPRYQNRSEPDRENAYQISMYFNNQLQNKYQDLKKEYPHCSIDLFDIKSVFSGVYNDVLTNGEQSKYAKYFDQNKLKEPYVQSKDFQITPEGTSPGCKHMFWDDVHPTTTMHTLLMTAYYQDPDGLGKYTISAPSEQSATKLCQVFRDKYHEKLKGRGLGLWIFSHKELPIDYDEPGKALVSILQYALNEPNPKGHYLRETLSDLGWWLDGPYKGPNMHIPALSDAMWILDPELAKKYERSCQFHTTKKASPMLQGALNSAESSQNIPQEKKELTLKLALAPEVEEKLNRLEKKMLRKTHMSLSECRDTFFKSAKEAPIREQEQHQTSVSLLR